MPDRLRNDQLPGSFIDKTLLGRDVLPPGVAEELRIDRRRAITVHDPRRDDGPADLRSLGALYSRLGFGPREPGALAPPDDLGLPAFRTDEPDPAEARRSRQRISSIGVEHLAWYDTFRGGADWGITIRLSGVQLIAHALRRGAADDWHERGAIAFEFIYRHEFAHFLFDAAAGIMEDLTSHPLWVPFRLDWSNQPYSLREEALCNAFGLKGVKRAWKSELADVLLGQPPGYQDFHLYGTSRSFSNGVEEHLHAMLSTFPSGTASNLRPLFQDHDHGFLTPAMVPLRILEG